MANLFLTEEHVLNPGETDFIQQYLCVAVQNADINPPRAPPRFTSGGAIALTVGEGVRYAQMLG